MRLSPLPGFQEPAPPGMLWSCVSMIEQEEKIMRTKIMAGLAALAIAASSVVATSPAQARWHVAAGTAEAMAGARRWAALPPAPSSAARSRRRAPIITAPAPTMAARPGDAVGYCMSRFQILRPGLGHLSRLRRLPSPLPVRTGQPAPCEAPDQAGAGANTAANFWKKSSAIFLAAPLTRRWPSWASLPPICASTL